MQIIRYFLLSLLLLNANGVDNNANGIPDSWESEFNITDYLPTIPPTLLKQTQIETDLEVRLDKIEAYETPLLDVYEKSLCDVSNYWDATRVSVGGRATGNSEEVCKVYLKTSTDYNLRFLTKWPSNNTHYPLTPEPAWAQFRFPIPKGHVANELEYELNWYKLFGSSPTNCHSNEFNSTTNECKVDVADNWRDDVDAGLYMLWTTPGTTKQVMTGPHPPIEIIGYSGVDTFKVKVPEAYEEVEELVVSLVAFNQYTKACEKDDTTRCTTHENENFTIKSVTLKTEEPFEPAKEPAVEHPRILGANSEWKEYFKPFDDLACVESAKDMDWGMVFNAKNIWDKNTKGVSLCKNSVPDTIDEVSDTDYYLDFEEGDKWVRKRALRIMFLLRDMMQCHESNQANCLYDLADVTRLKEAFISSEMTRFDSVSWDYGYKCFDIGTEPPVKFWSIFVDTFWSDLSPANKAKIDATLSDKIGCFLDQIEEKHWSIYNGNNWTAILDKAALYWAITYYHEDSRAKQVVKEVLRTLWLHRDFYLTDGSYMEGVVEYTNVSYSNLLETNNLMRQSFGQALASVRWERIEKTKRWYLDFMVPDGKMADFGDSWDKRGWSTFDPLHMMLWEEMIGEKSIGTVQLDACEVYEYFSNIWFSKGFEDPWSVQPSLARDWIAIVNECNQSSTNQTKQILFDQAESGVFKSYIPNATPLAENSNMRFSQANYTWLGFNGVPNDFPHRELDFGALIWSAYGNRLLYDFGYGEIGKTSSNQGYLVKDGETELWDNIALGANTLVVEDATDEHYTGGNYNDDWINSSQIYGARGELETIDISGHKAFVADGSMVYGKEDDEFGWLQFFYRYLIALDDGNYMVVDSFKTKDDRGASNVKEYWYSADEENNTTECSYHYEKVNLKLESSKKLLLNPLCSMLDKEANSTVTARIVANSLHDGQFVINPETIVYKTRTSSKAVRNRITYGSLVPVSQDIRVFLLQASPQGTLLDANISANHCDASAPCFDITIDGLSKRLNFKKNDDENFVIDSFNTMEVYQLHAGWNLIGFDQVLSLSELKKELGEENLEVVQGKDKTYQKKYSDLGLDFLNDFIALEEGKGYWIKLKNSASLSVENRSKVGSITLKAGWNIISPYSELTLSEIKSQVGTDNLLAIQGEGSQDEFKRFEKHKGYWIKVAKDVELVF
ncbi:MAG: hypothetical protein K0U38_07070 [Epsilonproteobacteria bacterium]|nr:hypothetical protein [Campylobacterota bacterium]